jgi:hypothetical protein
VARISSMPQASARAMTTSTLRSSSPKRCRSSARSRATTASNVALSALARFARDPALTQQRRPDGHHAGQAGPTAACIFHCRSSSYHDEAVAAVTLLLPWLLRAPGPPQAGAPRRPRGLNHPPTPAGLVCDTRLGGWVRPARRFRSPSMSAVSGVLNDRRSPRPPPWLSRLASAEIARGTRRPSYL